MYVYVIKVYFLLCVVSTAHHGSFVCFVAHMVTESNDRMDVLNKPVIVRWAYAGMSHGSDAEHLLLPDEFPSCCFTNGGSTSPPSAIHHPRLSPPVLASPLHHCRAKHSWQEGGGWNREGTREKSSGGWWSKDEWRQTRGMMFSESVAREDRRVCVSQEGWNLQRQAVFFWASPLCRPTNILSDPAVCWKSKVEPK